MGAHTTTTFCFWKGGELLFPILQVCAGERTDLEISLPEDLAIFAHAVNNGDLSGRADLTVRLTADLDLTGFRWVPIGFGEAEFAGVFDGVGHTIRGLTIQKKGPGNYGLFGAVSGTVQNVAAGTIQNLAGDPHSALGGIVGELSGGVVRNCAAEFTVDGGGEPLGLFAGGVAGVVEQGGLVQNCRSSARMKNVQAHFLYLGGVAGAVMDSRVERCTYTGAITVLGGEIYYIDVGGIAGNVQGRSSVTGCLHLGVLDASAYDFNCACIGGVIGRVEGPAVVRDCCNRGSVSGGERAVGGILGDFSLYDRVAEADCVLENCLNLGEVVQSPDSCSASCGGIVGEIINKAVDRPVQVRNCVSLGELNCLGKDGPAHPITAYAEGAVFENNYYDESLPAQGREDLRAAVAAGCAAKPAAYLTSNEFLEDMERRGGRYALGTDGMLTVRDLETGVNAYDDE